MRTLRMPTALLLLVLFVLGPKALAWEYPQLLTGGSYAFYQGTWSRLPDLSTLTPAGHARADTFDLKSFSKETVWALRYSAVLDIPIEGKYLLTLETGDTAVLSLDGRPFLQAEVRPRGTATSEKLVDMKAGRHQVRVDYLLRANRNRQANLRVEGPDLYQVDRLHWLYFGWPEDHPKSWSFMGGTVSPGQRRRVQFAVEQEGRIYVPDESATRRQTTIRWSLADEFMPSPVSEWRAGSMDVRIQHFAVRTPDDRATAVYSRLTLRNTSRKAETVTVHVNASREDVIPLSHSPSRSDGYFMHSDLTVPAGGESRLDFVALGSGKATAGELVRSGSFDENYRRMTSYYMNRMDTLAYPERLPDERMTAMYKAALIVMWESVVKVDNGDMEMRGSGGNPAGYYSYDRTFSHDVPNMVDQFIRAGETVLPKQIMASTYYQRLGRELEQNYLDAIPKYIIPYATYLQLTGDTSYFSPEVKTGIRASAHAIHEHRDFQAEGAYRGVMNKSHSLDNPPYYLLVDNFAALHGLAAYRYLAGAFGDSAEASWAGKEMEDLNRCFNTALKASMDRRKVDWYMSTFEDDSYFWKNGYDGNWIGTSLMMSTFPWDAILKEVIDHGTWAEAFDRSIEHAMAQRDASPYGIPQGSWGAWWGHEYGAAYNAGMGLQLLYSDRFRTEVVNNITFLLDNQSAPFQWGESFDRARSDSDWTRPAADLETWALGFDQQAIQEMCVSVSTEGSVIIGRGVPDGWLNDGDTIAWKNVRMNGGRKMDLSIVSEGRSVSLSMSGDIPSGNVIFDLPRFQKGAEAVVVDGKPLKDGRPVTGPIVLPPGTRHVRVNLAREQR